MRALHPSIQIDWLAVTLRWLGLLAILAVLALGGPVGLLALGALLAGAVWNAYASILALFFRRAGPPRALHILLDLALGLLLLYTSGGIGGPIPWCAVLAVSSAGAYYEVRGGLLAAVLISALQAGMTWWLSSPPLWLTAAILAGINLAVGLAAGLASRRLARRACAIAQIQAQQRKEADQKLILGERSRMQAFMQMVETLSSTLDYRMVLNTVLDLCANAAGTDETAAGQMLSAVLLFGDHDLKVEAARRLSPRDTRLTFPAEAGLLHTALQSAEPCLAQNPAQDPELGRMVLMEGCKAALAVPLRRGVNAYGLMLFAHPDPQFFTTERVEVMEMIGHQAVIAIQNARLYQDVSEEKERIVQTQEEERKKLARDLHDGPIQSVAAIAMRTDVTRHMLAEDPPAVASELDKIEELARRTTKELRHMLFTLRPLALESEGLAAALKTMAERTRETYRQNVEVEADQRVIDQLDLNKQMVVFYLVEEAVTNARKHAQAERIVVRLARSPQDATIAVLEVIDNGKGFNVQEVMGSYEKRGSLGMVNLRERADLINGLLTVDSVPGKGTRIRVFVPLTEAAADRLQRGNAEK